MRGRFSLLLVACLLGGCSSRASATPPSATPVVGFTDPASHVSTRIEKKRIFSTHALVLVAMHNSGPHAYHPQTSLQFVASGLVEPNSPGGIKPCDSDASIGQGLVYTYIAAGATNTGWIRCDYASGSHVFAVFWLAHELGAYRIAP